VTAAYEGVRPNFPVDACVVTAIDWFPQSDREVFEGWNEGRGFKIYNGPATSGGDRLRMIMSGWHHLVCIYVREDQSVHYCIVNLDRNEIVKTH
jgi:hypothetical protein